jgi:hypothetical protein
MTDRICECIKYGVVFYGGIETISFGSNLFVLPVDSLWNMKFATDS